MNDEDFNTEGYKGKKGKDKCIPTPFLETLIYQENILYNYLETKDLRTIMIIEAYRENAMLLGYFLSLYQQIMVFFFYQKMCLALIRCLIQKKISSALSHYY